MWAYEASSERFFLFSDLVGVPEGGSTAVAIHLAWDPEQPVTATIGRASGDEDLYLQAGATLQFDSTDFSINKFVTVAALQDTDQSQDTATFSVTAVGFPSGSFVAREIEDDIEGILYVSASAPLEGDGTSWETAFNDVQAAMDLAEIAGGSFRQIWVAAGVYTPTMRTDPFDPRSATFEMLNDVTLYGGFAGTETSLDQRDPAINETVLSGDLAGDDDPNVPFSNNEENAYHVVTGASANETAILDGFTVCEGNANGAAPMDSEVDCTLDPGSRRLWAVASSGIAPITMGERLRMTGVTRSWCAACSRGTECHIKARVVACVTGIQPRRH